nr:venom polypeptide precursor [Doratifera vulnerans]
MDLRLTVLATVCVLAQCEVLNLSCKQIKSFVDGHNFRRELLATGRVSGQPAATDMKYMVWDEELANKAAKWASHNNFAHNPDRTIGSGRFDTGENIYMYATSNKSYELQVDSALKAWFNEKKDYTYKQLSLSDFGGGPQTGHYTQMAWAKTTYIGCGVSEYMANGMKNFFVVCNYGPPGNFMGEYPYSTKGDKKDKLNCEEQYCKKKYGSKC